MQTFSIQESIKFSWETFKKRPWILIGAFVITTIIDQTFQGRVDPEHVTAQAAFLMLVLFLISVVVSTFTGIGINTFNLRAHDTVENVTLWDLWNPNPFWRFLAMQILLGLAVLLGLVLLIVPGIIAAVGLMFAPYLVIDKGLGPVKALEESWRITKGHKWQLFLFSLALIGLNILGLLALVVGVLVTIPVSMLASVHVYRKLEHSANEVTATTA
jgi:uncharacterized membrane protein